MRAFVWTLRGATDILPVTSVPLVVLPVRDEPGRLQIAGGAERVEHTCEMDPLEEKWSSFDGLGKLGRAFLQQLSRVWRDPEAISSRVRSSLGVVEGRLRQHKQRVDSFVGTSDLGKFMQQMLQVFFASPGGIEDPVGFPIQIAAIERIPGLASAEVLGSSRQ